MTTNALMEMDEVSAVLRLPQRAVLSLIRKGQLQAITLPGGRGQLRVEQQALADFIERCRTPALTPAELAYARKAAATLSQFSAEQRSRLGEVFRAAQLPVGNPPAPAPRRARKTRKAVSDA